MPLLEEFSVYKKQLQGADAETGELNPDLVCYDQETGEMLDYSCLTSSPPADTRRFALPDAYRRQQEDVLQERERNLGGIRTKREITLGYNPTHKLFLIPSLFLFLRVTALVLLFCELVLHIWAHRKNARNTDESVFYRSPLHLITAQFCAKCTAQTEMIKLGKIQDRRREAKRLLAFSGSVH